MPHQTCTLNGKSSILLCPHNPFDHPIIEALERFIDRLGEGNVYRIDEDGTIELISGGKRLLVKADR